MADPGGKYELPKNPTLKDINVFKKTLNWGELPPFFHMVAQSLGESEGLLTHGFDTALKRIVDKRNWNVELMGGYIDKESTIHCEGKPRLAIYQIFTERGFELHAYPYAKNKEIDQYVKNNRLMEFRVWDPHNMKMLLRINQLHKFIDFYFQRGDEADKALIIHAFKSVHGVISFLKKELVIQKVDGVSIRQYYDMQEKLIGNDPDTVLMAGLQGNFIQGPD
ncbi:MAG: hypothetical protein ACI9FJ_003331 [Alteromonadaceae bacterium]|jgi:hypothetical protein